MAISYLDDTYLGGAEDGNYEIGSADSMPAVAQDPMTTQAPAQLPANMVWLPGGIIIPKATAIILAAIAIAFAIWWWQKSRKKD